MQKKSVDNISLDSQNKNFTPREKIREEILKYGIEAKGKALFLKHLRQERLTASQAIVAFCYSCMAWYGDGKGDCGDPLCVLYKWMPYGEIVHAHRPLREKKSGALVCSNPPPSGNEQKEAGEGS